MPIHQLMEAGSGRALERRASPREPFYCQPTGHTSNPAMLEINAKEHRRQHRRQSCDTCEPRGRTPAPLFQVIELIVFHFHGPSVQWNSLSIKEHKVIPMTRHQASRPEECAQEALVYQSCICYYIINIIQPPTMACLYLCSQCHKLGGRVDCGNAGEEASTNTRLFSIASLLLLQIPKLKAPT